MALIRCPDCGKEISDKAPACIHCGRPADGPPDVVPDGPPEPGANRRVRARTLLVVFGALVLAGGLASLPAGKESWALILMALGLAAVLAGSVWAWLQGD